MGKRSCSRSKNNKRNILLLFSCFSFANRPLIHLKIGLRTIQVQSNFEKSVRAAYNYTCINALKSIRKHLGNVI